MINDTLIWFLLLPIIGAIAIWWFTGHETENLIPAGVYVLVSALAITLTFFIASSSATSDIEIWNGQVTAKSRLHGEYQKPYECRCRQVPDCTGTGKDRRCGTKRECDTCYEDRYTVTHKCDTTLGAFTIQHLDRSSRSVYNEPDPLRWVQINKGDPVSKTNTYTNYVQAVPESLFKPAGASLKQRFAGLVPAYPDKVYDHYKIDRFLTPGYSSPDATAWNAALSELVKERGPRKQVNTIVVVAKTADPDYVHALRDAWEGANKNDVVLVIGSAQWPKIDFVEVISWTKKELFKVQLRDEVLALGSIQRQPVMDILARQIDTNFERRRMREFEYLQAEIDPPFWLLATLFTLLSAGAVGVVFFLKQNVRHTHRTGRLR